MSDFVLNNLSKINTKRLLLFYKKVRGIRNRIPCPCCGEIFDEDVERAKKLDEQLKLLKEELDAREHILKKTS